MTRTAGFGRRPAAASAGRRRTPAPTPADPRAAVAIWLAVASAVVVLPGGLDRFVLVKTLVVGVAIAVGGTARRAGRLPRWAVVGLAAGVAWLLVSALASEAPWAQVWGRWPRYEGLVTLPAAVGALWLGARVLGPTAQPAPRRHLQNAVITASGLVGAVAVAEALGVQLLSSTAARSGALLGNASDQGVLGILLTAVLVPVLVAALARRDLAGSARVRAVAPSAVGVALAVGTVVLSGSRGALAGLGVALVTVGALLAVRRVRAAVTLPSSAGGTHGTRAALVVPAAVLAAAMGLALTLPQMAARLTGTSPLAGGTVHGRRLLWAETLRLIADRPLTGVGPSGYVEAIPAYHTARWAAEVGSANPPDSPHAWPLQAAVAGGVPLLLIAVALGVLGTVALARSLRSATDDGVVRGQGVGADAATDPGRAVLLVGIAGAAAGYAVATSAHFTSPGTTGVLALLLGAAIAAPVGTASGAASGTAWGTAWGTVSGTGSGARSPWRRRARWGGVGLLGAWLLVVAAATAAEWPLRAAYEALDRGEVADDGAADRAFATAQALRPWDGDVAVLAAHAFGTTAIGGLPEAGPVAQDWAAGALDRIPGSGLAIAAQANAAEAAGDLEQADALLTELVTHDPANAEWLLRRGVVRATAGELDAAEADFLAAAELSPDSPGPWQNLAVLYDLMDRQDDAAAARSEAAAR